MSRMRLLNETTGQTVQGFCIIKSVESRINVKGNAYLDFVLADSEGEVSAKLWDYNAATHGYFEPEQIVKIRAGIVLWKDTEQLKLDKIRLTNDEDDVCMSALVPCAPFDPEWMYQKLFDAANSFADDDLRRITTYMLKTNKDRLLLAPAAVKLHHAYRSGLLHHTLNIFDCAKAICPIYPALHEELVLTGVILHDLAKLDELSIGELGLASGYTMQGKLLGHINIGVSSIHEACELLGLPTELSTMLEHMVLAHHGVPEFGSPRYPMFPEAQLLCELDMLDSRMYEMFFALEGVPKGGFTERIWALENRELYQHGYSWKDSEA